MFAVGECCQHRGELAGLVAPLWEQAVILADVLTGVNPEAAYAGSKSSTKLKVAGVDVASMGVKSPERADDEFLQYYQPSTGTYKNIVIRDGKLIGATLLGDVSKVGSLTQAFDDKVPLPDNPVSLLFDIGRRRPNECRRPARRHAGVCLQQREQGRDRRVCACGYDVVERRDRKDTSR